MIDEVQQSPSEKGRLANKIYLGKLEHDFTPVLSSDGKVSKTDQPRVKFSPSETEKSETEGSETKESNLVIEDEEERKECTSVKKTEGHFTRQVDQVTKYDKDYIWSLVHSQLREGGLSQAASDLVMSYFEERYAYALEHIRFARTAEAIAEYVFNGVLSEWTKQLR